MAPPRRFFRPKPKRAKAPRRRSLIPSRILRPTIRSAGGGRDRAALVEKAYDMIAEGSQSFTAASLLFDRPTAEHVWMLYAWCRRCDDIADGQSMGGKLGDQSDLAGRVKGIRVLTRAALEGQPTAEVAFDAFGQVASETGLTLEDVEPVIRGFELDAQGWQPQTEADLMRYCWHVAGAVGVLMARVMGVPADDTDTLDRAADLGLAFQLANIARDVGEDAAAGRCYLPREWLAEIGLEPDDLLADDDGRFAVSALTARMIATMERHETAAKLGAARLPFRQRWAILSAARIYGAIGRKVRDRGQLAWDERVHTGRAEKLGHVAAAFGEALRNNPRAPDPMPRWTRAELERLGEA